MSSIFYWVAAVLMLGILITLHELGHFIMARITGIGVIEFAVGFGPKLLSRTSKKTGIVYSLRAFPLGGFCRFVGDETDTEGLEREDSYYKSKVWKRVLTSLAGPGTNLLVGLLLLVIISGTVGLQTIEIQPTIAVVRSESPAENAGFLPGDRIVSVNGVEMETTEEISGAITAAGDAESDFGIERDGELMTITAKPEWNEEEGRSMIGIEYQWVAVKRGAFSAFGEVVTSIYNILKDLITTGTGVENISGPIGAITGIKELTEQANEQTGQALPTYLLLASQISINLGLFNLLPIPGLDGSKLIFLLIEKIRGKPLDPNKEGMVTLVGFALLMVLMVAVLYLDISRLVG